jgi:hypothetical protein
MINQNWNSKSKSPNKPQWALLHLDSSPSTSRSRKYAVEFGKHLLSLGNNAAIKILEVPVIHQPRFSNDCGFYPAHFLHIILQDIDGVIDECFEVSDFFSHITPDDTQLDC